MILIHQINKIDRNSPLTGSQIKAIATEVPGNEGTLVITFLFFSESSSSETPRGIYVYLSALFFR
jgi:hypothetical protein